MYLAYLVHWKDTEDSGLKLAVFSTGPAIRNPVANLITEIIGTFVLVFGIFALLGNSGIAKSGIGVLFVAFLVIGIGMSLGGPTGYAINPARDLGPRIMHAILPIPGKGDSDWSVRLDSRRRPADRRPDRRHVPSLDIPDLTSEREPNT